MQGGSLFEGSSYAVAAGFVLLAASVRLAIGFIEESVLYFAVFYPAVLFATLRGGTGPGVFAITLSLAIALYALLPPAYSFEIKDRATLINVGLFVLSSGLLVWIAERYRRATQRILEGEEMRRLLVDEMRHRSRNTLSVAKSVIDRTLHDDPKRADTLYQRMRVLLNTDNLFDDARPGGESLHQIIRSELQPHGTERFVLTGETVMLPARLSRSLALILHELTTNAVKYGALATPDGLITVSWMSSGDRPDHRLAGEGSSRSK